MVVYLVLYEKDRECQEAYKYLMTTKVNFKPFIVRGANVRDQLRKMGITKVPTLVLSNKKIFFEGMAKIKKVVESNIFKSIDSYGLNREYGSLNREYGGSNAENNSLERKNLRKKEEKRDPYENDPYEKPMDKKQVEKMMTNGTKNGSNGSKNGANKKKEEEEHVSIDIEETDDEEDFEDSDDYSKEEIEEDSEEELDI